MEEEIKPEVPVRPIKQEEPDFEIILEEPKIKSEQPVLFTVIEEETPPAEEVVIKEEFIPLPEPQPEPQSEL